MTSRYKVAYIVSDLDTGGQERQLYYLVKNLPDEFTPVVYPMNYNIDDKYFILLSELGINIHKLSGSSRLAKLRSLRSAIMSFKPDIIHTFSFHLNSVTWLVSLGLEAKIFGAIRNQLMNNRRYSNLAIYYPSLLLPYRKISNNINYNRGLDGLSNFIDKYLNKTFIVHNGIDLKLYQESAPVVENDQIRTASIFRLHPTKRMDLLIELIDYLKCKGILINHKHAGSGDDLEKYQAQIKSRGLENHIELLGEIDDINTFLFDKHLFIHTADFEGCPNVIMEAMACGKPILSTNCGDVEHIIEPNLNGKVVPAGDLVSLSKAATELMMNPEEIHALGKKSRRIMESTFTMDKYRDKIIEVYMNG